MYSAIKNKGASLIRNGDGIALAVSKISEVSKLRLVVSRSHREPVVDEIKDGLGIKEDVSSGSVGLKVGLLVRSKCDLYIHPSGHTKEWDTCAPEIILEEAGGIMTHCWGQSLRYNKKNVHNDKGFIASNGVVHSEITGGVAPFFKSELIESSDKFDHFICNLKNSYPIDFYRYFYYLESGKFPIAETRRIYDIRSNATIYHWLKKFGKNHLIDKVIRVEMKDEKDKLRELERQKQKLESVSCLLTRHEAKVDFRNQHNAVV